MEIKVNAENKLQTHNECDLQYVLSVDDSGKPLNSCLKQVKQPSCDGSAMF